MKKITLTVIFSLLMIAGFSQKWEKLKDESYTLFKDNDNKVMFNRQSSLRPQNDWRYVGSASLVTTPGGPVNLSPLVFNSKAFLVNNDNNVFLCRASGNIPFLIKRFDGFSWQNFIQFNHCSNTQPAISIMNDYLYSIGKIGGSNGVRLMRFSLSNGGYGQSLQLPNLPPHYINNRDNMHQFAFSKGGVLNFIGSENTSQKKLFVASYRTHLNLTPSIWHILGGTSISTGRVFPSEVSYDFSMKERYIAFRDFGENGKIVVKKYNGSTWDLVGDVGLIAATPFSSAFTNIKFVNGTLYIALSDVSHNERLSVLKFNGSSWVYVGNPGFVDFYQAGHASLAIDNLDNVYVAFANYNSNGSPSYHQANTMKYNALNDSWNYLGNTNFSAGGIMANGNYNLILKNNKLFFSFGEVYCPTGCFNRTVVMSYNLNSNRLNRVINNKTDVRLSEIKVFPNPSNEKITITNVKKTEIELYTIFGVKLKSYYSLESNLIINIDNLKKGSYFLRIFKNNTILTKNINIY